MTYLFRTPKDPAFGNHLKNKISEYKQFKKMNQRREISPGNFYEWTDPSSIKSEQQNFPWPLRFIKHNES